MALPNWEYRVRSGRHTASAGTSAADARKEAKHWRRAGSVCITIERRFFESTRPWKEFEKVCRPKRKRKR